MTQIAFDSQQQLDALFIRMQDALSHRVAAALAATGSSVTPELQTAVERLVLQEFAKAMKNIITTNVTIAGQKYVDKGVSSSTEPFNDKLNDDVLKYQTKVHDSVLENATKRKEAPAKAQAALDVALNSWQMARQRNLEFAQSERERMDGKGREERKYVNSTIPDVMDTGAKYLNVLETLARIDAAADKEREKGYDAKQVQLQLKDFLLQLSA